MKKNLFYSVMALCMAFFASCSQEEIVSTNGGGDNKVRLSVNVSGAQPNTRATQSLDVEGYVMRCIAQAVNADGTLIEGFNEVASVSNGTAHFEFEAPEDAANYLFWADYVSGSDYTASNSAFYDAEDLTAVGYRLNQSANLFNNQAADAFCGSVAADNITGNVTLKRPFTRLAVRQSQVESMGLTGLTNIVPNINAGTDYNVYSKATATKASIRLNTSGETPETLTALTTDENPDFYFFCYAFAAPADQTTATTIVFNDGTTDNQTTLTIAPADMQALEPNTSRPLTPEEEDNSIQVDIDIDNSYGNEPTLKVGAYVDASGQPVATAEEAVGIVFAMGALGEDVPANYPEALQSKTIAAYAVALENVATSRQALNEEAVSGLTETEATVTNGTQATEAFRTSFTGSAFVTAYDSWVGVNPLSGENVSTWYIPTLSQLQAFMGMLFTIGETQATGSEEFRGMSEFAFTNGVMFDRDPIATVNYASCTVNDQGNLSGVRINCTEGTVTNAQSAGINVSTGTQSALCRPMFTIFE